MQLPASQQSSAQSGTHPGQSNPSKQSLSQSQSPSPIPYLDRELDIELHDPGKFVKWYDNNTECF